MPEIKLASHTQSQSRSSLSGLSSMMVVAYLMVVAYPAGSLNIKEVRPANLPEAGGYAIPCNLLTVCRLRKRSGLEDEMPYSPGLNPRDRPPQGRALKGRRTRFISL
jgi:hypothetical protein